MREVARGSGKGVIPGGIPYPAHVPVGGDEALVRREKRVSALSCAVQPWYAHLVSGPSGSEEGLPLGSLHSVRFDLAACRSGAPPLGTSHLKSPQANTRLAFATKRRAV